MTVFRGIFYGLLLSCLVWIPACWLVVHAQTPLQAPTSSVPTAPALTDVQKLQVQNAVQAVELWQLRAQNAASEFEKAREALTKLVASVTPSGYQLSEKLELVPVPPVQGPPASAPPTVPAPPTKGSVP